MRTVYKENIKLLIYCLALITFIIINFWS